MAVAAIGCLQILFYRTGLGRAFRATADSQEVAQLMGLDNRHVFALAMALPLYAAANLVLHFAGMQNPNPSGATAGTSSQLAGLIGISSGREVFPLTTSINLYSIVVGASVASILLVLAVGGARHNTTFRTTPDREAEAAAKRRRVQQAIEESKRSDLS